MTIQSQTNLIRYEGNGATTVWSYAFLIPVATDVIVTYTDAAGAETALNANQYSITGIDDANGGAVTYPLSGSPIAANTFITIQRSLPLVQSTDLVNQDGFYPQVVEDALDYQMMVAQQISTLNSQAIRVPSSENPPDTLPAASVRASQALIFDSAGQPTVGSIGNATISAAMQPVAAASTLLSARTLLGVAYLPVAVSAGQTVVQADISKRYMATGALTFNLPDSTQVTAGFSISIYALTADCPIHPVGTDTIYSYGLGNNATATAGTVVEAVTDGAGNWWLSTVIAADDIVGHVMPYAGFVIPSAKYDLCDGGSYLRSSFPALFTATTMSLTVTKTNGNPVLGGFTSAQTAKLAAGMLVEGTGIPSGATILTTPSAGDTSITLNQNSTNGTSVTAIIIPFGAADSTHANRPDYRGRSLAGAELATNAAARLTATYFGSVPRIGRTGGLESHTLSVPQMAAHNHGITDPGHTHGNPDITGQTSAVLAFGAATPQTIPTGGRAMPAAFTGIATQGSGGDNPHNNTQPTGIVNYLIRVLP
jgi:microcystin-dependent protein